MSAQESCPGHGESTVSTDAEGRVTISGRQFHWGPCPEPPSRPIVGGLVFGEQFHDLVHPLRSCRRNGYPRGSWRTHLRYSWEYRWEARVRQQTACRIGRHRITEHWTKARGETFEACHDCDYEPTA